MIEQIGDPMVHIIRNAVDHGLETPQDRLASGKPAVGTISISAEQKGSQIIIEVSDDGRGINVDRVKKKALQRALITEEEAARMTDDAAVNLIFLPGSTAEVATELSGRGVGMDVVKTNVSKLNGTVEIITRKNAGSTFIIRIPLTLAIIQTLMVTSGNARYAIPLAPVEETLMMSKENITDVAALKLSSSGARSTPCSRSRACSTPPRVSKLRIGMPLSWRSATNGFASAWTTSLDRKKSSSKPSRASTPVRPIYSGQPLQETAGSFSSSTWLRFPRMRTLLLKGDGMKKSAKARPDAARSVKPEAYAASSGLQFMIFIVLIRGFSMQQHIGFRLQSGEFAIPIMRVREIINLPVITHMPQSPSYFKGITNLRGSVIPVVDLKKLMHIPEMEGGSTKVIVISSGRITFGSPRGRDHRRHQH